MSNSSNNLGNSFENVFKKNKKIVLAAPIVLLALILGLYFTSSAASPENENVKTVADTTIPSGETKPLSDSKVEVTSDYQMMTAENNKKQNKANSINLSDPNVSSNGSQTYEQPDDKVVSKLNKMLVEMDKSSKKTSSGRSSSSSSSGNSSYSEPRQQPFQTDVLPEKKINYAKESIDDFFASKSEIKKNTSVQQSDSFIYAVIKGDQFGLKNNDRVKLMLAKNTVINGKTFLKNTVIYAQADFQGNRVNFSIRNINQIPMNLKAYDAEDGGLGLHVNQSLAAETSSEVVSDATDELDISAIPLGGTLKKLFKKKQQVPKIDLLNNQKLILKTE